MHWKPLSGYFSERERQLCIVLIFKRIASGLHLFASLLQKDLQNGGLIFGLQEVLGNSIFLSESEMRRLISVSFLYVKYGTGVRIWLAELSIKTGSRDKKLVKLCPK